jgi:hypothetical protein
MIRTSCVVQGVFRSSKKSRWDFSTETSALRARFAGVADKPHTCADRSVFCLGRAEAKNGFQKLASWANLIFSTNWDFLRGAGSPFA